MAKKSSKTKLKNKHQNKQSKGKNKKKKTKTKSANQNIIVERKKESNEHVSNGFIGRQSFQDGGVISGDASLEDIDHLIDENGRIRSFSEELYRNHGEPMAKRRKKEDVEDHKLFEDLPRKLRPSHLEDDGTGMIHLLPIKNRDGLIQRSRAATANPVDEDAPKNESLAGDLVSEPSNPELTMLEVYAQREANINENKSTIARLCEEILENPDAHINNLKKLLEFCCKGQIIVIQKLAIVSVCEIFKDIVPGYRIRPLSEQEKNARVSKDVKKLRDFEEALVVNYKKYLDILEELILDYTRKKVKKNLSAKTGKSTKKVSLGLALTATRCMNEMLINLNHFNYRTNLIVAVVSRTNLDGDKREIGDLCIVTLKNMFKNDEVGDVSVEALKVISRMMKGNISQLRPQVLETVLHLNINSQMIKEAESRETKIERIKRRREEIKKLSRTEKKRKKLETKLDKELQETEAVESRKKIQRFQTDILKTLFVIYFRVLKQDKRTPLLTPVLKGLSKYAHLISVDFFNDLMKSLKRLINSGELTLTESLNCVLTSFKILSGQGESLNIDLHHFYLHLYNSLVNIGADCRHDDFDLCVECLDIMLLKRRKQVSLRRVLGFLKRTATIALHLESEELFSFMGLMRGVLQLNQKCDILLDNENIGRGVFQPELTDPEHCNAESSALWELILLSKHYCADAHDYAHHLLQGAPSQGQGSLPKGLAQKRSFEDSENPPLQYYFPNSIPSTKKVKGFRIPLNKWNDSELQTRTNKVSSSITDYDLDFAKLIWKT